MSSDDDKINHPKHYNVGSIEVWDFIKDQGMDYFLGNAIKYICRCMHKGKFQEDLDKAIAYINKAKKNEEEKQNG